MKKKTYRSKVPFRISFGGGGTDMPDYCKYHTGAVINTTIRLFTHTSLELRDDTKITFKWINKDEFEEHDFSDELDCSYGLKLFKATHNHICKRYNIEPIGYDIVSYQDVPTGSGLGTSSTLIVSLIGVYMELFNLPLGEYDIAEMAIQIERVELKENGGKQDQYAAAFGGFNYMEFKGDDVIVNPLRIKDSVQDEMEAKGISTPEIELLYNTALKAGATGGKISGAGGGGFMFFYCPNNTKYDVIKALDKLKMGYHQPFTWNKLGIRTWQIG